jgi:hypothetical protein
MKSTLRPASVQIQNPESFQLELQNRFDCLGGDVDEFNDRLVEAVHVSRSKFFKAHRTNLVLLVRL